MQNIAVRSAKIRSLSLGFGSEEVSVIFVSVKKRGQK